MKRNKECVVIGAGLAGLAAAYYLTNKHCKVTVLEARDRLGGRVLTHHLCEVLNLGLQKHQYANSFWNQLTPAKLIPPSQWCMSAEALAIWQKFQADFK